MKCLGLVVAAFFAALPLAAQSHYYSTSFTATENPICENAGSGCVWVNGGTTGISWGNIQTTPGLAFGVSQPSEYGDPTAILQGTWDPDQTAQATVHVGSTPSACCHEVELRLRVIVTPQSITGYEINCSLEPTEPYLQIVRWDGAVGKFTYVGAISDSCANGDVLKASISGSTITVYKNGKEELTGTDSAYTTGDPGMSFYDDTDTQWSNFGFSQFTASDSSYTGQKPSPPTKLTGSVVPN
ncbi:MAG TPA: hypothetical protein VHX37_09525 [Acidobacteriaceae bacterium]|jgi:hypothetical protein|nr:hypothetical protein [Acidobacteriaceae bacterium]